MRVLLVAYFYSHPDSIGGLRLRAMAEFLRLQGFDVSIIAASHAGCIADSQLTEIADRSRSTGPCWLYYDWRVWYIVCNWIGVPPSPTQRWLNGIKMRTPEILHQYRPDVIIACHPPADAFEAGMFLAGRSGARLVLDFRDGLSFDALEQARGPGRAMAQVRARLEAEAVRRSAMVLAVSEPLSRHVRDRYGHHNVLTLPNGFDRDDPVSGHTPN